ncbi:protein kinase family protein [Sporosarcina sp. Marseille-Q4063]|uniref:protein kinase family protein n=1 Tax=Sporosarcina sp. Marseille-Q4063 TaxID=2810514 RepID=UPI001BAF29DC|nr:protein kinase family protein [Sporosarcina sp. Marseille-Q4063]QUW22536.1 protein kinase family protein [Sporosarcina sp. Marseille-Q4063]
MNNYQALANSVIINKKNRLVSYDDSLKHIGTGRSAFVFKIKSANKAIKIFFPEFTHIAKEEAEIYQALQGISYYPSIYGAGLNYIVMDFIEGLTLFDCVSQGKFIEPAHIKEIDYALSLARARGLNPSDIHLRNLFITTNGEIKIIDVARFRQKKNCRQWHDLKKAYYRFYRKRFFPKKVSAIYLNIVAFLYKKGLFLSFA